MYRDEFLNPIIKYDAKYHLDLLKTLNAYIRNDGDLKKTAAEFFQHINTTRYRLEKIKELLNMEGLNYKFFEEVSTAIKIDKILPNSITHEWD
jgi:sugar diacid utilization regulator